MLTEAHASPGLPRRAIHGLALAPGSGATGLLVRQTAAGGAAALGGDVAGDRAMSAAGQVPASGGTGHDQVGYRNRADFSTGTTFNLTNSCVTTWSPWIRVTPSPWSYP